MLEAAEFHRACQGKFGREFYNFAQLDSTNKMAAQLAKNGCPDGTVVFANEQTKGRGRKGNAWHSPADLNLYFSVILYPEVSRLPYLPFCAGLAVVGALEKINLNADLKWPNDVLVNGKKICGLMLETSMEQNNLRYAITGCGVNVNGNELSPDIRETATTVLIAKGASVCRESLLASIDRMYAKYGTHFPTGGRICCCRCRLPRYTARISNRLQGTQRS